MAIGMDFVTINLFYTQPHYVVWYHFLLRAFLTIAWILYVVTSLVHNGL